MAPKPSEHIRLKDILAPPSPVLKNTTVTRKTSDLSNFRRPPSQCARKSTGRKSPKPSVKHRDSPMPYHRLLDDSDGTEDSLAASTSSAQPRRPSRTPPSLGKRKRLEEPEASTPCDLCHWPLKPPLDPNQPIHDITTICHHRLHYPCYTRFLTTALIDSRACCPKCGENLLTQNRYRVDVTTSIGNQYDKDITDEVQAHFTAVRAARQQLFVDCLSPICLPLAAMLLDGPDRVDVNHRTPVGGFTALHLCAYYNNVAGIDLLLSHNADPQLKSDDGLTAADWAKRNNAFDAVTRLT
ncbi:hypothetical protein C8R46DRAFT_1355619 [Mycena filopes]|nr:hypothetical protein C8R46DRAFT_1355619 [Mycena filopes]